VPLPQPLTVVKELINAEAVLVNIQLPEAGTRCISVAPDVSCGDKPLFGGVERYIPYYAEYSYLEKSEIEREISNLVLGEGWYGVTLVHSDCFSRLEALIRKLTLPSTINFVYCQGASMSAFNSLIEEFDFSNCKSLLRIEKIGCWHNLRKLDFSNLDKISFGELSLETLPKLNYLSFPKTACFIGKCMSDIGTLNRTSTVIMRDVVFKEKSIIDTCCIDNLIMLGRVSEEGVVGFTKLPFTPNTGFVNCTIEHLWLGPKFFENAIPALFAQERGVVINNITVFSWSTENKLNELRISDFLLRLGINLGAVKINYETNDISFVS
jgi:hypothetical protein